MKLNTYIKILILFLLTFLLGAQTTYAKTEFVLPQNQVVFSIEQSQSFKSLEKELQPNIGFLKEKAKFVAVQLNPAVSTYNFSKEDLHYLANGGRFKAGDNIVGKIIVQVRTGTNGKTAVIGRKMDGHVNDVVSNLQSQGKQVEAFNDVFQSGKSFTIDGSPYSWEQIKLDFSNTNNQYLTNSKGYITDVDLPNTLMYKANQQWVQKLIDDGYEIIDMGYPVGQNLDPSLFYNMELNLIFP